MKMRAIIDVVQIMTESVENYEVRGKTVPVMENPSRSQTSGFRNRYGVLRASAIWDGSLLLFPANLATHGDIYDGEDQWPVIIAGMDKVVYRIDSSFDGDIDELADAAIRELRDHSGLKRALQPDFAVEVDRPDGG